MQPGSAGGRTVWIAIESELRNLLDKKESEGKREAAKLLDRCCRAGIDLIFPRSRVGARVTIG